MANKIEKQKGALNALAIILIVLSVLGLVGSVLLVVFGALTVGSEIVVGILQIVFGGLLFILAGFLLVLGLYMLFIGLSVKATHGSIKQDNIPLNGTVNMNKCKNCGTEVSSVDKFCPKCGASLSDKKVCPKCGATNMSENTKCSACGADL